MIVYCLLYVNDLEANVPLYKYVDDSTLFEICNTTDVSVMQESIDRAVNWTHNNCMKINSKKPKEMVICFTPDEHFRNSIPSIVIEGNIVETVEYAKLLGVTLSNDLTWNRHVDCIVKKAAKRVYMLYQLKRAGISQLDLVTVYIIIIIIKLYLYTDKSGTAAPFTGVYTHYDKKKYIDHKSSKRKNIL